MADHEKSVQLRHILQNLFTQKDLKTLCFDLKNVDFEDLEGNSKEERIMSLLQDLDNRNRLGEVENWITQHRLDIDLEDAELTIDKLEEQPGHMAKQNRSKSSVTLENSTAIFSNWKIRGMGTRFKNVFSFGSKIDTSTTDGADTDGE